MEQAGNPFKPEYLKTGQEGIDAREQLEKVGNVWISPDIRIENSLLAPPGQLLLAGAHIILNKRDLPPIDLTKGAFGALSWSMRSFLAQCRIEIEFHRESVTKHMLEDLNDGKDISVPVDVINHGQRAVELEGNVMRFYWANDFKRLRGDDLVAAVNSGEFYVEGKEGEDWYIAGSQVDPEFPPTEEKPERGLCVVVKLKPEKFYTAPAADPIRRNESRKIRDQLDTLLVKMPEGERSEFEIGETPHIKLGPNIVAVINTGHEDSSGRRHIRSPLIDAGSDWPIRTETYRLDYVEFFLYRK
jgi:hypothetical protein